MQRPCIRRSNYTAEQSLNCKKKKWGNATPSIFSVHPFLSPFLSPLLRSGSLKTSLELCKLPHWGPGLSPGRIRILVYCELENRIWRQHFFYKRPKTKQLYRQEVPGRRSKIYTSKNFRGLKFPGEFPPPRLYVWKKHWSQHVWFSCHHFCSQEFADSIFS